MKRNIKMPSPIGRDALRIMLTGIVALSVLAAPTLAQENPAAPPPNVPITDAPATKGPEERNELMIALMLPVSVRLNNATVKQMAEAVSKVSKLTIRVDESVPDSVRINLDAHRIPVATLLEAMARRADLLIAKDKDEKGILLTRPPVLKVDNTEQSIGRGGTFPWSEDWGIPPSAVVNLPTSSAATNYYSGRAGGFSGAPVTEPPQFNYRTPSVATNGVSPESGFAGFTAVANNQNQNQNLTYTSVGDSLLVVSEPGRGEKGEAGVWLTVYRIDKSGSIGKVGTLFHAYREVPLNILIPGVSPAPGAPNTGLPSVSAPSPDPLPQPTLTAPKL